MTLKQSKLLQNIPKSKTLSEAGEKSGYSKASRAIYRKYTKQHIADALKCDPESIIRHYEGLYAQCLNEGNSAVAKSILDSLCRINAMFKDRQEITNKSDIEPTITNEALDKELNEIIAKRHQNTSIMPIIPKS